MLKVKIDWMQDRGKIQLEPSFSQFRENDTEIDATAPHLSTS